MVDLFGHNQEAFQEINKMIESGVKRIAVPRATGSGKTYLMGALAEKFNDMPKLVLEPTRPLLNSIKEKFDEFAVMNTDFMTYQKLIRMSDGDIAAMDYKLIFLDECHHGTAPVWGKKIDCMMATHSDSIIFGTSATTVRNDGVNVVETIFEGNVIGELPLSTAIARKVLPCPKYITAIYRLDDEFEKLKKRIAASTNTKDEKKEFYCKMQEMKQHFEKSYGIPLILNKYVKVRNGKYLVFCKDKKHLDSMRNVVVDWFRTAGVKDIHSYAVYSDYPDKEKDYKEFCEENSDSLKLLFSINMLNEGLHIEDISGVLMLRTTRSNLIYLQQLGRLLEAGNMDKYLLVFDFVNNFSSVNDGVGLLKEIKDAVAREKESAPDFDDSEFEDVDTFFVLEQVVEIQEMFKEIEGRLEGSWDLYIKALKQYKEREGDCLVPPKHIEILENGIRVQLGNWVSNMRNTKSGKGKALLTEERIMQLEKLGFIWNELKYRFEKNVDNCINFYKEYGRKPNKESNNKFEKKLGNFWNINCNDPNLQKWKIDLLLKIPSFFEKEDISTYEKFYKRALKYKEKYGNLDFEKDDEINGRNIYQLYHSLKSKKDKLTKEQIEKLKDIGVDLNNDKVKEKYNRKMKLARQAVCEGIIISNQNKFYKGVNFYNFKNIHLERFTKEELEIMNKLVPNPGCMKPVKVIDIINNQIYLYLSIKDAARALYSDFHIAVSDKAGLSAIIKRLRGETKNLVYKGFRFEYATDKEIKKYMEENKVS